MTPVIKRKTHSEDQREKTSEVIKNILEKIGWNHKHVSSLEEFFV